MSTGLDTRFDGLPVTAYGEQREREEHGKHGEHGEHVEHGELRVIEAKTHRSRRRGLSRLDALPADHALLIPATPSVHTFGMRFALDLIWLDKSGKTIRVDRQVPPRRMRYCRGARAVIECNGGQADAFTAAGVGGGANPPEAPAAS